MDKFRQQVPQFWCPCCSKGMTRQQIHKLARRRLKKDIAEEIRAEGADRPEFELAAEDTIWEDSPVDPLWEEWADWLEAHDR